MIAETKQKDPLHMSSNRIPLKLHPRVFAALGADLVTNDIVAVMELVKNSYDAGATQVQISFADQQDSPWIEILDDGCGMSHDVIENVWCVVATPNKRINHYSNVIKGTGRRVSGEKGLGRLSAARLGSRLEMVTKSADGKCWQVEMDWNAVGHAESMDACEVDCQPYHGPTVFRKGETGTRIRVSGLHTKWTEEMTTDLRDNLTRLISPFHNVEDFSIRLKTGADTEQPIHVESPRFLESPKYKIVGSAHPDGSISATYTFKPLTNDLKGRICPVKYSWEQVKDTDQASRLGVKAEKPSCGTFTFEIRVWDLDSDGMSEIVNAFGVRNSSVRATIGAHKGLSVYRDGILVLPKSDSGKDWLGLDLRRVSKVGGRLSTSQIIGYVSISGDTNDKLADTSNREGFMDSPARREFEALLWTALTILETYRQEDKTTDEKVQKTHDLIEALSLSDVLARAKEMQKAGSDASAFVGMLKEECGRIEADREKLKARVLYFNQLATTGTIAQLVLHEIRNRTTALAYFPKKVRQKIVPLLADLVKPCEMSEQATASLERLADNFAPLATRGFCRSRRISHLRTQIENCLAFFSREIKEYSIRVDNTTEDSVALLIDPAELDAIFINLINNAVYWLINGNCADRQLSFKTKIDKNANRIRISVHDSGPGIPEEDTERIFWPGVTRKPDGVGMGLTVVSEVIGLYGGKIGVKSPGRLGGASFYFDLPVRSASK